MGSSWITAETIDVTKRVLGRYLVTDLDAVELDALQVRNIELLELLETQLERELIDERGGPVTGALIDSAGFSGFLPPGSKAGLPDYRWRSLGPPCGNCGDNSGWHAWYPKHLLERGEPKRLVWVACADCNDDGLKPKPKLCSVCGYTKPFCLENR